MAGIKADNTRQENPGERKPGPIASLGLRFDRHARHHEARTTQTAALARQGARGRASRMQMPTGGAGQQRRMRPAGYASQGVAGGGRQKIMVALIPVLAIALLYLMKNPLTVSTPATAQDKLPAEVVPVTIPNVEIAWEIPPLYQVGGRDPMRLPAPPVVTVEEPVAAPTQPHMDLIVTGILYSEDRPAAIVDTFLVHEGEQISGATVKKIEKDGVEFEMNGRTWKQAVEVDKK
jgi:hypothetical protein